MIVKAIHYELFILKVSRLAGIYIKMAVTALDLESTGRIGGWVNRLIESIENEAQFGKGIYYTRLVDFNRQYRFWHGGLH